MTKDDYKSQADRIMKAAKQLDHNCSVDFDSSRAPNWLRFRITIDDVELTKARPEFHVSEVADWSEEKIKQTLESVTGGILRVPASRKVICPHCGKPGTAEERERVTYYLHKTLVDSSSSETVNFSFYYCPKPPGKQP